MCPEAGHFRPLLDIFGAKGLFKDTFLFEGRGCIPSPSPLDARLNDYTVEPLSLLQTPLYSGYIFPKNRWNYGHNLIKNLF